MLFILIQMIFDECLKKYHEFVKNDT